MKIPIFSRILKQQRGITLVEVLVGVAISSLLVTGVTAAIAQTLQINASNVSRMTVVKQVENAIDSLRQDVLTAQKVGPDESPESGEVKLTLTRTPWEIQEAGIKEYVVEYEFADGELIRTEYKKRTNDILEELSKRAVARHIQDFEWEKQSGPKYVFTISARIDGLRSSEETRIFDVYPRSATTIEDAS